MTHNTFAIETSDLRKSYDGVEALRGLSLQVPTGSIFGFLGRNGAGKTTTIKILLGLAQPTGGTARVFSLACDTQASSVEIRRRTGFVSDEKDLIEHMTVEAIVAFTRSFYPRWRTDLEQKYLRKFDLPVLRTVKQLSRGMRTKLALLLSLCRGAELLILDEPTSGLDPLVQQTFNELLFEGRAAGRTVFLSSHIISEVERTCDRVAIIREGRITRLDTVEGVRSLAAHEVELRFASPVAASAFAAIPGVTNLVEEGRALRMLVTGAIAPVVRLAGQFDLVDFVSREPSLEEVFLAEYETTPAVPAAPAAPTAR